MNFEVVTIHYMDIQLKQKKEMLDTYHNTVSKTNPSKQRARQRKTRSNTCNSIGTRIITCYNTMIRKGITKDAHDTKKDDNLSPILAICLLPVFLQNPCIFLHLPLCIVFNVDHFFQVIDFDTQKCLSRRLPHIHQ